MSNGVPGISFMLAVAIIAETGLNTALFPNADHLVSWIGLCRSASQSGTRQGKGRQKKGNSYARCLAGQAALGASRTSSFPGERYARVARRRGKAIAQIAVARSIMIIVWAFAVRPAGPLPGLGADWYQRRTDKNKKIRNHIRQLQAPGLEVTITAAGQAA